MKRRKLPIVRSAPVDARDRVDLSAWLREWEVDRALPSADAVLVPAPRPARRKPVTAGEVRLLRPADPPGDRAPRYVLVLDAPPEGGAVLVAPFSRFPMPATPGEWRTGHAGPALRVLCLWNARRWDRAFAERAWPVTRLPAEDVTEAKRVLATGADPSQTPPEEWRARVGPPLRHPSDPRWDYLHEEAEAWDAADGAASGAAAWTVHDREPSVTGETSLPMAAEPPPAYRDRPPDPPSRAD